MKKKHRIAAIAGDGIGTETLPEGLRVLEAAASRFGIDLAIDHFDFASWKYYERHGSMMPDDWKEQIGGHDAIFFGPLGWPATMPTSDTRPACPASWLGWSDGVPPPAMDV